ncbi:CidA/LrgA family protein [Shewanella sp. 10N.286.51.B2]|uniref:CidA/LrgA family protein n=1 Tax=unclassified Shewanella TaxID=196818 RepID=UPI0026E126A6|nr:CidA/LrgA family protein [Shewanella sp. 5_MG-2023]MDO6639003.1 CidA/LrgA family protein [Shewanella sp. 5_MG-2023]
MTSSLLFVKRTSHLLLQVAFLCGLAFSAQYLVELLALPIPSSVIGLIFLYSLLAFKWLPERFVAVGAMWLIGELLLFFIPPVIASIHYAPMFEEFGGSLMFTLVLGSISVLVITGFVIDRVFRFERRRNRASRKRATKMLADAALATSDTVGV